MSEGIVGGILGEEDEAPEVEATETLAAAEAFAAAVAALATRQDPGVARKTEEFLSAQSHLLKVQADHLKEEHSLRIAHLRNQLKGDKVRGLGLRLRVGFQLFLVVVALIIGVGAITILHDAITSNKVIVESFHAPPSLAAHGIDGSVVASGLLDELSRLQNVTRSSSVARGITGAWTENIKLEVPETGVSVGEISRVLNERFGNDVHIDGELIETVSGEFELTVRGNGVPPKSFAAPSSELKKLLTAAAEYVYSVSQPGRWATYLTQTGRDPEAIEFCQTAVLHAVGHERASLLSTWSTALQNTGGSDREAVDLLRAAVQIQPDLWISHGNLLNALVVLGDEEGAWRAGQALYLAAGGRPGRAPEVSYQNWDYLTWNLQVWLKATLADAATNSGFGTQTSLAPPVLADIYVRLHDLQAAKLTLLTAQDDANDPAGSALIHHVRARLAAEAGDVATAFTEMEAYGKAYANRIVATTNPGYHCWIAPAEEAAGHQDKADALLQSAGSFVDCYRFHADILASRGDWTGAQEAYARAVELAPDLPAPYYSWGSALLKHGDLTEAEAKLIEANKHGPHWADPLKAWGDVLAKQGRANDALVKYDQALEYAPKWTELKDARAAAAGQNRH